VKAKNALNETETKILYKSNRVHLAEALGSLDPLSNEKRVEKLKKQLDSVTSQKQLLQTHVFDSQQKTMEVRSEVSCAQKQLESVVGPQNALTTVTLSEFLHYKNMQEELDAGKSQIAHLQKTLQDAMSESLQNFGLVEQCGKLLQPLYRIVRQNRQITDAMEEEYNDIMANLCGTKVHWGGNRIKSPEKSPFREGMLEWNDQVQA